MNRLALLGCAAAMAAGVGYTAVAQQRPSAASQRVTVYKTPT
ncbi:MAG: hypothetical protein OEW19_11665 [Acidobacteriota bacterium]|nr:hypothetical protein [Acidobacteriota bacterium]